MSDADRRLRILAFEPFDDGSHRAVRRSISRHSAHEWRWFTRSGRAWKWRMRLAAVELAEQARAAGALDEPFDAVFATSLLAVSDLRALLAKAGRGDVPVLLYMHENQATYPAGFRTPIPADWDAQFAMTNLTGMLAADRIIFNSRWNRDSFITGITALLGKAPDLQLEHVAGAIESNSEIIWPPVEPPPDECFVGAPGTRAGENAVRVVWPHRWEHDKGPDELLDIAVRHSEPCNLRWTILGQRFREVPEALRKFEHRFGDRIDHIGYIEDRDAFWQRIASCDWVLSTAQHEFFGIAVVEALLAGCLPWLPDRLSYPELLPAPVRNLNPMSPPADPESVRTAVRTHLESALATHAVTAIDVLVQRVVAERASGG